jgi:hypothetical protein
LYFVAVDQLSIPCRQVLLEGVLCQSEVWQVRLSVPVFLYFSSHKGLESFVQFQDVPSRALDTKLFMKTLWSLKKPNADADIPPPISKLFVVAGDSGSGKSHWCLAKGMHSKILPKCWLHIVVHEGFSTQLLIDRYRAVSSEDQPDRIGFHFDVSEYCDLELFGVVLHDFFSSGLMVDSITGDAQVLLHGIEHLVFVDTVLRNQNFLVSINNKVAAEIINAFVLVLFANSLHLAKNAKFRANHNWDFSNVYTINSLIKLLGHPILVCDFCGDMDINIDTA